MPEWLMVLMAVCFPIGIIVTLIIVEHIWDVSVVNVRQLLVLTLFLPCTLFAITLLAIKIIYYKFDWLGNLLQKEIRLQIRKEPKNIGVVMVDMWATDTNELIDNLDIIISDNEDGTLYNVKEIIIELETFYNNMSISAMNPENATYLLGRKSMLRDIIEYLKKVAT